MTTAAAIPGRNLKREAIDIPSIQPHSRLTTAEVQAKKDPTNQERALPVGLINQPIEGSGDHCWLRRRPLPKILQGTLGLEIGGGTQQLLDALNRAVVMIHDVHDQMDRVVEFIPLQGGEPQGPVAEGL